MWDIRLEIHSDKKTVREFLRKLKRILGDSAFQIDRNLFFNSKKKEGEKEQFSTAYTMVDLDYDAYDVIERLKELAVHEYSHTLFDRDNDNPPLLFVFGKDIQERIIYIKLKIREGKKKIICVSFHYAEYVLEYPYQ